jgi:CRISPR/Cas system-associated exonuclease Cas4 (RecB family)
MSEPRVAADSSYPTFPLAELLAGVSPPAVEWAPRPRDRLWASELGLCDRAVWFAWNRPREVDRRFTETRGALGHYIEDGLARVLAPITIGREVSLRDDYVSGRVDFLVRLAPGEEPIPIELKTTYAARLISHPMTAHVLQLRFYLTQMPAAPYGLLIYYRLDYAGSGSWTALRVSRADEAVRARVEQLWAVVHSAEPPPCREPGSCFYCLLTSPPL